MDQVVVVGQLRADIAQTGSDHVEHAASRIQRDFLLQAGDAAAAVGFDLREHGVDGLRVADASIMPRITSGNTNAPSIMIGEKCADLMRFAA